MNRNESEKIINSALSENASGLDRNKIAEAVRKKDGNALINSLSEEDKRKLNSVLTNKEELSRVLKNPAAKALMKALLGGKNG